MNPSRRKGGRPALHLGAAIVCLAAMVAAFVVFFPYGPACRYLEGEILRRTGLAVTIGDLAWGLPPRLRLFRLTWQPPVADWPPVTVDELTAAPVWSSLIGGNVAVALEARLGAGLLRGELRQDGDLRGEVAALALRPFFPARFAYPPQGNVHGSFVGGGGNGGAGRIGFELTLSGLDVDGLAAVGFDNDRLSLGDVGIRGEVADGRLSVAELGSQGGELVVRGSGSLLLAADPRQAGLAVRLEVRPAGELDPLLAGLLAAGGATAAADGTYRLQLDGTLARPQLRR
ncbi:MAG: type II secretion system protein GspN [Thermodesulfobacteriota bacterium]